jgi:DNA-binding NtrC family response regulator
VVDDEPNFVKAVQRALKHEGYSVLGATTMAEAFEQLALHEAHVLLCDQRMPEMMGTDFLAQVRDMYPQTVRVMLTAYPESDIIADAINRGAVYKFLTKPLDDAVLRREVADAFAHYRRVYESGR